MKALQNILFEDSKDTTRYSGQKQIGSSLPQKRLPESSLSKGKLPTWEKSPGNSRLDFYRDYLLFHAHMIKNYSKYGFYNDETSRKTLMNCLDVVRELGEE